MIQQQPLVPPDSPKEFAAFVGIDWADQKHAVCLLHGERQSDMELPHTPEAIAEWALSLRRQFGGVPVAVAVEQSRGALIHALMQHDHLVLFPINPKQAAHYREALSVAGRKDDPFDAQLLARFLREHHDRLRPWKPDDGCTRELGRMCELRRNVVEARKHVVQQLTATLKLYFPQALKFAGDLQRPMALELLRRWPCLKELQRANPTSLRKFFRQYGHRNDDRINALIAEIRASQALTTDPAILRPNALFVQTLVKQIEQLNPAIEQFEKQIAALFAQHEDAAIFRSLPGAGAALAPRLCVAMGTDRTRFADASNVQAYSGIAPVTKRSGKSCHVNRRFACPKFIRQTFHEFADHARKWSAWSKAYYQQLRSQGSKHHAAVRALAFKWIRIIFRLWKGHTCYDEAKYTSQLIRRNSPLAKKLTLA